MSHAYAFFVFTVLGVALVLGADTSRGRLGAAAFAGSVAAMFGTSALYHCLTWRPSQLRWIRRLDHAMIYVLIAGTYTPVGLLVLDRPARVAVLAIVWAGALSGIVFRLAWIDAPTWLTALIAVALGWVGIAIVPQLVDEIGAIAVALFVAGGVLYTAGAVVYARRKPDPLPAVFGYHELFHALVIAAVACQYVATAFFVVAPA